LLCVYRRGKCTFLKRKISSCTCVRTLSYIAEVGNSDILFNLLPSSTYLDHLSWISLTCFLFIRNNGTVDNPYWFWSFPRQFKDSSLHKQIEDLYDSRVFSLLMESYFDICYDRNCYGQICKKLQIFLHFVTQPSCS
jgi:hypothetical protein